MPTASTKRPSPPASAVSLTVALLRLTVGLAQGLALYLLYIAATNDAWPATEPYLFAPLLLIALLTPVLLIASMGHMSTAKTALWIALAAPLLGALACYDIWRTGPYAAWSLWLGSASQARFPSPTLMLACIAGCSIAQVLILAGSHDRRRIARYPTYFDKAWAFLIQLKLSLLFVAMLWLALWLGAALFLLVQLPFLRESLGHAWFAIPVLCAAFSCGMHLADARPAIVNGARQLLLALMYWILPLITLIVAGFLLSLPFTGLQTLWATRRAASVLLGAAAALVLTINAAFQSGETLASVPRVVRVSARIGSLLLPPLCAIAAYAVGLRVAEYGWTTERIYAAAGLAVASCYALGYPVAALRNGAWVNGVARVNTGSAFALLAVLLALSTPLADPARLAVLSQMARLDSGKVDAAHADFDFLRFQGARFGHAALETLSATTRGADPEWLREKADATLKKQHRWDTKAPPDDLAANVRVWPAGTHLPDGLLREPWRDEKRRYLVPACLKERGRKCDAYPMDLAGDGKPAVLLVDAESRVKEAAVVAQGADGHWRLVGRMNSSVLACATWRSKLIAGDFTLVPSRWRALEIGGRRIEIDALGKDDEDCDTLAK